MKGITVDQLARMCKEQQKLGNGKKYVVMSSDDECNEYHAAWSGLTDAKRWDEYIDPIQWLNCPAVLSECCILT